MHQFDCEARTHPRTFFVTSLQLQICVLASSGGCSALQKKRQFYIIVLFMACVTLSSALVRQAVYFH